MKNQLSTEERYVKALEGIKSICQGEKIFKKADIVKEYGVSNYIFEALKMLNIAEASIETKREGNVYTWKYRMPANETMYKLANRVRDMIKDIEKNVKKEAKKKKNQQTISAIKAAEENKKNISSIQTVESREEILEDTNVQSKIINDNFNCDISLNGENITKQEIIAKLEKILSDSPVKKIVINITY